MVNLGNFWSQLFHPLDNSISIFFAVLIALLTAEIIKQMDNADRFMVFSRPRGFVDHLLNFLWRFLIAFTISLIVIFIVILFISIIFALIGYLIQVNQ